MEGSAREMVSIASAKGMILLVVMEEGISLVERERNQVLSGVDSRR